MQFAVVVYRSSSHIEFEDSANIPHEVFHCFNTLETVGEKILWIALTLRAPDCADTGCEHACLDPDWIVLKLI